MSHRERLKRRWRSNSPLPASTHSMRTRSKTQHLCRRCQNVNLNTAFSRKKYTKKGTIVFDMGNISTWKPNSCALCELLMSTFQPIDHESHILRCFSSSTITFDPRWQSVDINVLSLDPDPADPPRLLVSKLKDGSDVVRILDSTIHFEVVREWVNYCDKHHIHDCGLPGGSRAVCSLASFRLINCKTRKVIRAPKQPYTALSYVWGIGEGPTFSEELPEDVSNIIDDAIKATLELGFQYMWVDRYCINQGAPEEIAEQVPKMDLIYNCAEVIIIAAAGQDPSYGLPGIRSRSLTQPHAKVGDQFLVSTLHEPDDDILWSKWWRRGWTLQEGVLSRRRLVFTDHQVYYECSGMYCFESLSFPLSKLHTKDQQRFKSALLNGTNSRIFPHKLGNTGWEVIEQIHDYTGRLLTKGSDILNGILGILRALEQSPRRLRHCLGVPVISRPTRPNNRQLQSKYDSMVWTPTIGLCLGLCWDVHKPSTRREGFPSSSWTGWYGQIEYVFSQKEWIYYQGNQDMKVDVQLQDGRMISWDQFETVYGEESLHIRPTLHIATWVIPLEILGVKEFYGDPEDGREVEIPIEALVKTVDGRSLQWYFPPMSDFSDSISPSGKWIAVNLAQEIYSKAYFRGIWVVILYEMESGVYQRVGINKMEADNMNDLDPEDESRQQYRKYQTPLDLKRTGWSLNLFELRAHFRPRSRFTDDH
ncbi:heterokaryon incompatibility protein-domain-containing protein [Hypoxylon trugodes]|uniref:heterokaryon incompatibility protein-domain-containing protein n=1 Tax=Hypoxylon trugodes TaxID=326681 RepID=UPI0021A17838|nr:heterokaryon incompatibility protein-domain-containing protein [Hypoxylon trugodes]KAI1385118.1 heterokaryon incompatibility protein-domain-containing protein [Hypoxylon trugodes]